MLLNWSVWAAMAADRFVVQLTDGVSVRDFRREYQGDLVETVTLGERFKAVVGKFTLGDVERFFYDSNVTSISHDAELRLQQIAGQSEGPGGWSLVLQPQGTSGLATRSAGRVDVYVFDTGIDSEHPGLQNVSMRKLADFTENPVPEGDPHGHGTLMAGLIASETFGVLKGCNLMDVRVADQHGKVRLSQLLRALSFAVTHVHSTRIPALFLIPMIHGMQDQTLDSIIQSIPEDIALLLPAGNQHRDACDFSPLNCKHGQNVLVVGSVDQNNHLAKFSNYGKCVDVYAPGTNILSLSSTDTGDDTLLRSSSGTSVSCAIGAGVVGHYMSNGLTAVGAIKMVKSVSKSVSIGDLQLKLLAVT